MVELGGVVVLDRQHKTAILEVHVRLLPRAFHYAAEEGGYLVSLPPAKRKEDKLWPPLMRLMIAAGTASAGRCTDEYYKSAPTFADTTGTADSDASPQAAAFEHSQLMESIRPPADTPEVEDPAGLQFPLYPFQRKALGWMKLQESRHQLPFREQLLHPLWDEIETPSGAMLYMNVLTGTISKHKFLAPLAEPGGCLADEMGACAVASRSLGLRAVLLFISL